MNFLKKSINTISNAVEINKLKIKRDTLNNEKKELETLCKNYDEQVELKENLEKLIQSKNHTLTMLRTIFTKKNIKYEMKLEEFKVINSDPCLHVYKKLNDDLVETINLIEESVKHLEKYVNIDKKIYTEKILNLEQKITKINDNLNNVREKQFGK